METQFRVNPGTCASAHDGYEAIPARQTPVSKQSWKFVSDFERLVGVDSEPDPQFFVESWTLGMAAAVESFNQRRRGKADVGRWRREFDGMSTSATSPFVQGAAFDNRLESSVRVGANSGHLQFGSSMEAPQSKPEEERQPFGDGYTIWEEWHHPITLESACRLLGVLATGTQAQIKAAYRRKVSQFHPDRLGCMSDEERRIATERMAAINEAYRYLRSQMPG
jgi:DnaJ-domain-containing protein 1